MKNKITTPYTLFVLLIFFFSSCALKKADSIPNESTSKKQVINSRPIYYDSKTRLSDILNMKLSIDLNWDSCFVNGTATLTIKPYFYSTDKLILNANGFEILNVKMNNKNCLYSYDQKLLTIQLDKEYTKEETYSVTIKYIAKPNKIKITGSASITSDKGFYFINPNNKDLNKPREFWTQGETEANSCWFPTIETGNEKYSQEISITVENKFVTLSNGKLMYSLQNSNGTRTDFWKQDLPHSPYLTMIAGGEFQIIKDSWRNMEVNYYLEPKYAPYAKLIFGKTPEMLEFFSKKLGIDYPWDKYAQIVVRDFVSGAMENTSAVTFFPRMNMTDRDYLDNTFEEYISHELFHQWFGDLVTAESWPNLPLNESFATYGEYLWNEYKYGKEFADYAGENDLRSYLFSAKQSKVNMIRYQLEDRESMFDANSYQKGGRILHMLRKYVGDEAFFNSITLYLETNKFKSVEIHQLRLAFEETTGEDLNWFFDEWFLSKGHPELLITYEYNDISKKCKVNITQEQNTEISPIYKIPLMVDIYSDQKVEHKKILLDKLTQSFEFDADKKPELINVDADKALVCTKKDQHTKEEWIYLYNNGPLYLDRMEALIGLKDFNQDLEVQKVYIKSLTDSSFAIRNTALKLIKLLSSENKEIVFERVSNMAIHDNKSSVRVSAILSLEENYLTKDKSKIYQQTKNDSAWSVVSTTLIALNKSDKKSAFELSSLNENTENFQMNNAIGGFYAENGSEKNHSFFLNFIKKNTNSFGLLSMYTYYKVYLKRMDDKTIKEGVDIITNTINNSNSSQIESSSKIVLADMLALAKTDELKNYIKNAMTEIDKK